MLPPKALDVVADLCSTDKPSKAEAEFMLRGLLRCSELVLSAATQQQAHGAFSGFLNKKGARWRPAGRSQKHWWQHTHSVLALRDAGNPPMDAGLTSSLGALARLLPLAATSPSIHTSAMVSI